MLRMRSLLGISLLTATVSLGSVAIAAPPPGRGLAHVADESRGVSIRPNPAVAWQPLAPGARVPVGAEIAASEPAVVHLRNGARVELSPGARVALRGLTDLVVGRTIKATRLEVRAGEIAVEMPAGANAREAVLCASKDLLALVQPGSVARARGNEGRLVVAAYRGVVRVATTGAWKELAEGHVVELAEGGASEPATLNPGPAWAPDDGTSVPLRIVTSDDERASLRIKWSRVSSATGYLVELARDPELTEVLGRFDTSPDVQELDTPPLPPGRYHVRVRARGASGLPGHAGPARALRVARLRLPIGARVEQNAVVLPVARFAAFDDPKGLEMALTQRTFSAAPTRFGLGTETPVNARVRLVGERASVPLKIVPRPLHAEIEIGPKTAVWPRDPVDVTIRLTEARRSVDDLEPILDVRLNLDPLPVVWHREGDVWKTTIEPRRLAQPSVIRVEAKDPEGFELGRAHLEVIGLR